MDSKNLMLEEVEENEFEKIPDSSKGNIVYLFKGKKEEDGDFGEEHADFSRDAGWIISMSKKFPILSKEEEFNLGRKMYEQRPLISGTNSREKNSENGNGRKSNFILSESEKKMVESNIRLVIYVAMRYLGRGLSLSDLIQEGNLGLMKASSRYEYWRGYKFSTFAVWWIRQSIWRAIYEQVRMVRIPVNMLENISMFHRVVESLVQKLGRDPNEIEISKEIGKDVEWVKRIKKAMHLNYMYSTDSLLGDSESLSILDMIPDEKSSIEDLVNEQIIRVELKKAVSTLKPKEELVINKRFGLDEEEQTLEQVGELLDLTRERIRQIENKAIKRLRKKNLGRLNQK